MRVALYPGTFDPITLGHADIIRRACPMVDRLVIGVAINRDKGPLFSLEERVAMIKSDCADLTDQIGTEIVVHPFENLLIDCAQDVGAQIIFRGLRAVADFEYEYQMVGMNRMLNDEVETVFLMADAKYQPIASKLVKEIARLGGDVSKFVTPQVRAALLERL
ncbi:pantetheine-phosphate adenylyltransferase [Sedimentitalea todarodis]|uniref:Phosphopantetheine adenylyltransferase n=1 Tax=Sedimentitalea todarodis TaxID=1631240 RepID=A0ABU3VBU2_9RHOB|nr:pantetheine-phosphate adenylyltransferase [Sedimentitalea todarodis]MDU9003650.1 pantetheine-phosphate adenylyltransferase [Sedimentitalea todarodis]